MITLVDDRYEIGRLLASGGMADVFVARDRTLGRRVAVKRLKSELADPVARDRFEREAYALAAFSHPNAVAVYDAGEDGDGPYIVMELVDGPTLREYMEHHSPMTVAEVIGIASQVLSALSAAHAVGIVHRDVKPANVLMCDDGMVKLADFGIAKTTDDTSTDVTLAGYVVGTPRYLAPEVARGGRATPRSDVYAVGVVLAAMLRGVPRVPRGIATVVDRALADDPARRYRDAAEMRAALVAAVDADAAATVGADADTAADLTLAMEPTVPIAQAAPVREPAPSREPARKRRGVWALAIAAVLAVIVVAAFAMTSGGSPSTDVPDPSVVTFPGPTVVPTLPITVAPTVAPTAPPTVPTTTLITVPGVAPRGSSGKAPKTEKEPKTVKAKGKRRGNEDR